jgi:ubiquinone/menaquinone biosynthesis C-methylase UbiE
MAGRSRTSDGLFCLPTLRCPACHGPIEEESAALRCVRCGRRFPVVDGIPALLTEPPDSPGLAAHTRGLDREAARYALVMAGLTLLARAWPPTERRRLIGGLRLRRGDRVLDHCSGPGGNLPAIAGCIGREGSIVAMDLSPAMLRRGRRWDARGRARVEWHQAAAVALPYADGVFDAVVHVGAINQFGDATRRAVAEMVRVTRPGGVVTIVDEGLAPWRADTLLGRLLVRRNALFASRPPLDAIPPEMKAEHRWVIRGIFYQIVFRVPGP